VIIGTVDPNIQVAGNGIKKLIEAGVSVTVGVLEEECYELNKRFFTFHNKKRPYIILKWAESQDGFIAPLQKEENKPVWITNQYSRQLVHKWRSEEQSILVGTQTAIDDNPKLDVRDWTGKNPTRLVIDANRRIPDNNQLFDNQTKTIVICKKSDSINSENCIFETIDFQSNIPEQIAKVLYKHNIQSVIIEGGSRTLQTFIDAQLWDEARIFKGNSLMRDGIKAPKLVIKENKKRLIIDDELLTIRNYD
jgi:diaminohydroxyphosphoribosylaminopyrimidine deaminase/5-amino-6-(5-phosphoribosylamino)uracil reductase